MEQTTAEIIGAFRKELISQGVGDALADEITLFAARDMISCGVSVRKEHIDG